MDTLVAEAVFVVISIMIVIINTVGSGNVDDAIGSI
jgi:hypothetical protein